MKRKEDDGPFPKSVFPTSVFPRRIFPWMGGDDEGEDDTTPNSTESFHQRKSATDDEGEDE